jgi:hypothetical protein
MKNFKSILAFCLMAFISGTVSATIRHVNNNQPFPGGPSGLHYTSIQSAIDAATTVSGDTIYIEGSALNYGDFTIPAGKSLSFFGPGFKPTSAPPLTAQINNITINENTVFHGLVFNQLRVNWTTNGKTFSVIRCKILDRIYKSNGTDNSSIYTIEGCVFTATTNNLNLTFIDPNGSVIRNCIFNTNSPASTILDGDGTIQIRNCIFLGTGQAFNTFLHCIVANCIFYRSSPNTGAGGSSTFSNCISFQCANNNFQVNTTGNLVGQNPLFENFPLAGANYSDSYDFRLDDLSPGKNNGDDFTDRGLFGGATVRFVTTGEPTIPVMQKLEIINPIVQQGTDLNINIISTIKQ